MRKKIFCRGATASAALLLGTTLLSHPVLGQQKAESKQAEPSTTAAAPASGGDAMSGLAAYYHSGLNGRRTASGQRYNAGAMTTAHPTLPFGTRVKVTNVKNNRAVIVRVNDRGPTQPGRVVDLSYAAARQLGILRQGLAEVKLEVVK